MNLKKGKLTFLYVLMSSLSFGQMQIGNDIVGESGGSKSGSAVSLSADGSRLAIGAKENDDNGTNTGQVRIYERINGTWTQIGSDIEGTEINGELGFSVSLSNDGTRVAIGAPGHAGKGRTLIYDENGNGWSLIATFDGEGNNDRSGSSVSLSDDGSRIAIGAPNNTNANGGASGHCRMFQETSSGWVQIGTDIDGATGSSSFGTSVSLSGNGNRVAIGAPNYSAIASQAGHVRIFRENNGNWIQVGTDIHGEAGNDISGASVSLSDDGTIVAIGAPNNSGTGPTAGHVRVYKETNMSWNQLGADIDGEAGNDRFGTSVSLSGDGKKVAISAPLNGSNGPQSGQCRIMVLTDCDSWGQLGNDIDGDNLVDQCGSAVSLSSDGSFIATGSPGITSSNPGLTRIFTSAAYVDCSAIKGLYRPLTLMPVGSKYVLEVIENDPECCSSNLKPTFTSHSLSQPYFLFPSSGCYSWRVRTEFSNGCSTEFSEKQCSCETSGGSKSANVEGIESIDELVSISAIPNPTSDIVTFEITDPTNSLADEKLTLSIVNILGKEVYRSDISKSQSKTIDVSSFEAGIYIYKVVQLNRNEVITSDKLVIK